MCDDGIKDMFNSGVVVFDKSVINDETYNGVLAMVEESPRLPDQVIINDYFKDKIRRLPHRYNVTGPILAHIKRDRIAVYHYAGSNKPWNSDVKNNFFQDWINYAKSLNLI
jgi:lipopolysaccharide biosynthesis glycosyltransferase